MSTELETESADMSQQKAFVKSRRRARKAGTGKDATPDEIAPPAATTPAAEADIRKESGFIMADDGLIDIPVKYTATGPVYQPPEWICAPFKVTYRLRGFDNLGWRFMLRIVNHDCAELDIILADADIGGQDGGWVRTLADAGLKINPEQRRKLARYLITECDHAPRARGTEKTGLFGDCYVLHQRTIGKAAEPIIFTGDRSVQVFSEMGSAEEWREQIGRYAPDNSRMVLAICASLAAPLLPMSAIGESGGFHLFGGSGDGKTTLAKVAASLWGLPSNYLTTWRNTSNATEGTAARFNHFPLVLDEIREASERDLQPTIMMLGNGGGKARMRDNATLRERLTWLLLWLSTGEFATQHYLEQSGVKADPGAAVRQVDIPSDAGSKMGVFKVLHGQPSAKALAEHLRDACDKYHGAVGVAWLEYITANIEAIRRDLPADVSAAAESLARHHVGAESQVLRVIRRFGLLSAAGELASKAGLTGWPAGAAHAGIRRCVDDWLKHRGGAENLEERRILERLRDFIGRNWQGRFIPWDRATDERAPAKSETVGYSRTADPISTDEGSTPRTEFYITPEGRAEIFKGLDPVKAGEVLLAKGVLVAGEWSRHGKREMRPYRREYLPGMGRRQVYKTVPELFELLGDSGDEGGGNA